MIYKILAESGAMPAELNRILKTIRELDYKYEGEYGFIFILYNSTDQVYTSILIHAIKKCRSCKPD